jgi:hypothetical protein
LKPFPITGAGGDPEEVRRFELMVWRVFGLPETFGGDVKTGNLATAQSLDRPTELNFLEKQEAWREDLVVLATFALMQSNLAVNGSLREAMAKRNVEAKVVSITEAKRISKRGETVRYEAKTQPGKGEIELMVTFPSIREGDIPALVSSTVEAMTLGNSQGQVVGIDEKAGVRKLYEQLGIDDGDDLIERQYPESGPDKYDPNRTKEDEEPPAPAVAPAPVQGAPQPAKPKPVEESLRRLREAIERIGKRAA